MSFGIGFGDVLKMADICAKIYKYGFSKANRAPSLYNEFGEHVRGLGTNLDDLQKIVGSINQNSITQNGRAVDSSYTDALVDILGDYGRILQDCEKFLKDRERFSWQNDFVNNIHWNFDIAGEVQRLKDRVAFMNIKLMTFLKTLDLRMANQLHIDLLRVHEDLVMRIAGVEDTILVALQKATDEIVSKIQNPAEAAPTPSLRTSLNVFDPPDSLKTLFLAQLQGSLFESVAGQFPLSRGLDAVVFHISTANTISSGDEYRLEKQWLAIAKALWIIARVKEGKEYKNACSLRPANGFERQMRQWGITVASYVQRLDIELLEIAKSKNVNSSSLDLDILIETFEQCPDMWFKIPETIDPTPSWELEYTENIMNASLQGSFRGFDQSLHLFKQTEIDLKLVITDTPRPGTPGSKTNTVIPVDVRRSRFVPLYAAVNSPSGAAGPLNITFQGDRLASGSSAFVFNRKSELLKFQHAITGYKVVQEAIGIGVVTFSSAKMMGGNKSEYSGRLQLWRDKKPQNTPSKNAGSSTSAGSSPSTVGSGDTILAPVAPISPSSSTIASSLPQDSIFSSNTRNRRDSTMTTGTAASRLSITVLGSRDRRGSNITMASAGTSVSTGTTARYRTSVVASNGTVGVVLEKPEPSLMVFLIQAESKSSAFGSVYASLAIEIDEATTIDQSACKCRKDPSSCMRVVIQRTTSSLKSFRQDATDLEHWNLAALGKDQRKNLGEQKERLAWVAIDFGTMADKNAFEKMFKNLRTMWEREKDDYANMLRVLRDQAV